MKPRWFTALMLITLPVWFIPGLLYVGWKVDGRNLLADLPKAFRWVFLGKEPGQ